MGVKGEAMAVNEAEHTTGNVWKVRREERLLRCEVGVTVVRWCCHTHTGNEVMLCVYPVDFWWPVNTRLRMGVLEAQDGGAVGVAWPFPSGLASGPLRALIEHFQL